MTQPFIAQSPARKTVALARRTVFKIAAIGGVTVAGAMIGHQALPDGSVVAITLAALCLSVWATGLVPEAWTALLFLLLASILNVAPTVVVFSGFASPTFWLFFSGLVLSSAMTHTGLGTAISPLVGRVTGGSYKMAVTGCVFAGMALAFVLPSAVVRMMLLLPVVVVLAQEAGYDARSNGRTGMMLGAAFGTLLPAFAILPANTPNMILAGAAEAIHAVQLSYFDYLLLHYPVLGLLKGICLAVLIPMLFPASAPRNSARVKSQPLSINAKRLAFILFGTLCLWLTDTLHGISPAWIGLSAALICLVPRSGLVGATCLKDDIGLGGLLFLAGLLGVGAMIADAGVGDAMAHALETLPDVAGPNHGFGSLVGFAALVGISTNLASIPVILTPLAETLATYSGLSLTTVLMTQVVAFSTPLLPYQVPPLIIAKEISNLSLGAITKLCLAMFVVTTLVLLPLDIVWWHLLGRL